MRRLYTAFISIFILTAASAQGPYFVDGYHGGIYGHYPVEWKTDFIVDQLDLHPEWRVCLEIEPETWDTVRVSTPRAYARLREIAADSRVEFTNPTYAQPYCYNISGESIIRHFAYGIEKVRAHFSDVRFTTYSVEEPCFTSSLPQILRQFGFKYAVLKCPNTCWGGYAAPYGGELVNWVGPDGSRILTVPRYACEELEKNSVWQTTAWGNSREYLDACYAYGIANPVGMCFQDAGWKNGPWIGSGLNIKNNSTYVTWREYFEGVTAGAADDDYRFSQEDVRVSLMWGSQVLQRIARQVRESENSVVTAEKVAAIASLANGYTHNQDAVDEAWRTLMLAQHHDSWIVPYNRLHGSRTWAQEIERWTASTDSISSAVIADAAASFDGAEGNVDEYSLRVFNTLGVAREEMVTVTLPEGFGSRAVEVFGPSGKRTVSYTEIKENRVRLSLLVKVPPFGYATYRISQNGAVVRAKEGPARAADDFVLDNDMYRIVIDAAKGGTIKSLVAKKEGGKEYAVEGGEYALGELRGFFYDEGRFRSSTESPAEVTILTDNPLEKSISVTGTIASHPFTQVITIRKGQRRIDFRLRVDWQGDPGIGEFRQRDAYDNNRRAFYDDRYKLNVMFPVALDSPVLYKDAPFDVCRSTLDNTHFNTWDGIKHNIVLHWVDLAGEERGHGFALLTDHTTSYSYGEGFPLALTAQYSGNGLWGRNYGIDGSLEMNFAVVPHRGGWDEADIQGESLRWNEPLVCSLVAGGGTGERSYLKLNGTGYELSAAYPVPEGVIIRLFNGIGTEAPQRIRFGFGVSSVSETDPAGKEVVAELPVKQRGGESELSLEIPRFGLKTLLVRR